MSSLLQERNHRPHLHHGLAITPRALSPSLDHCQSFCPCGARLRISSAAASACLFSLLQTPSSSAAVGQTQRGWRRLRLCSQWHRREAGRALETKSRNSARAGGRRSRRHTHSFKHTHIHRKRGREEAHTRTHSPVFRAGRDLLSAPFLAS